VGIKMVGQIAREYQVHPPQVTQWKGVIRDHLPELFEPPQAASQKRGQPEKRGQPVDWNSSCPSALFILADLCWGGSWAK